MRKSRLSPTVALIWALAFAATAQAGTVTGSVTYLDRMALAPGAVLDVQLLDVSRMDVAATRLSQMRLAIDRVPFPFALSYDDRLIDDRFTYAIDARILDGDRVTHRSTRAHPVLTRGAGNSVEIVLDRMPPAEPAQPLAGDWQVTGIGGRALGTEYRPTIRFEADGAFSADSTCNRISGTARIAGGAIAFPTAMAATRMACDEPRSALERDFTAALGAATGYAQTADGGFSLTDDAGQEVLHLAPIP